MGVDGLYRPYRWRQNERSLGVIFRDHFLSDLIGFVYSKMDASVAAEDFLRRIRENCAGILHSGRDATVPIILDGENAWEYYDQQRPAVPARTLPAHLERWRHAGGDRGEALRLAAPNRSTTFSRARGSTPTSTSGSARKKTIDAWTQLLRARQTYDASPPPRRKSSALAFEELLIAEGSDWCWWYGPEHDSANREEFDQLYRSHLANVYRFLDLAPPEELSRPILRETVPTVVIPPTAPITPIIDGRVTSYFEWMGAGVYRVDDRSGSMHNSESVLREIWYGGDGSNLFLRVDLHARPEQLPGAMELRVTVESGAGKPKQLTARIGATTSVEGIAGAECVAGQIVEIRIPLRAAGIKTDGLKFQLSLWKDGLPVDAAPRQGWIGVDAIALGRANAAVTQ